MPVFTIEMTSDGGEPRQYTVAAADPGRAVVEALREFQYGVERGLEALVQPYDKESDPRGSYTGWSRIVISLDGQEKDGKWVRECDEDWEGDDG